MTLTIEDINDLHQAYDHIQDYWNDADFHGGVAGVTQMPSANSVRAAEAGINRILERHGVEWSGCVCRYCQSKRRPDGGR